MIVKKIGNEIYTLQICKLPDVFCERFDKIIYKNISFNFNFTKREFHNEFALQIMYNIIKTNNLCLRTNIKDEEFYVITYIYNNTYKTHVMETKQKYSFCGEKIMNDKIDLLQIPHTIPCHFNKKAIFIEH